MNWKQSIAIFLALCFGIFTSTSFANGYKPIKNKPCKEVRSGFYIGIQGGYGKTNDGGGFEDYVNTVADYYENTDPTSITDLESRQGVFGARGYVGYNINDYLGLELGGAFSPNNKYTLTGGNDVFDADFKLKTWYGDLNGILSIPVAKCWEIFVKGGVAYVNTKITGFATESTNGLAINNKAWRPTFGGGINWLLNKNIVFGVTASRVVGRDKTSFFIINEPEEDQPIDFHIENVSRVIPTCDLISLGITYRFTSDD